MERYRENIFQKHIPYQLEIISSKPSLPYKAAVYLGTCSISFLSQLSLDQSKGPPRHTISICGVLAVRCFHEYLV